ncbi:MAG: coproporphyrinogen dehydrogenase HemZ [Lachnospiraceae bacterium]|nr:coproporphyrinogen dehydrogenase HemZ [Lachnospiraceae bacterium]
MVVIDLSDKSFFYDVMSLAGEFYPGETIREKTDDYEENEKDIIIKVPSPDEKAKRLENKNVIKRALYRDLSERTGKILPWGTLSGIRPVKLITSYLENGLSPEDTKKVLFDEYYISQEKAEKGISIAISESKLLKQADLKKGYSLYIGIPFCPSVCLYCSFSSYPVKRYSGVTKYYVTALKKEIEEMGLFLKDHPLDTIYIGGGTPTSLSGSELDEILCALSKSFPVSNVKEFTVEAGRPDSVTKEKLSVLKDHGVTRISINPQTMNDKTLKVIGRAHTADTVRSAFSLARDSGFSNINCDIIAGLPGEDTDDYHYTASEIKKLSPESLTVHSLARKRASRLTEEWEAFADSSFKGAESALLIFETLSKELSMEPYYLYRQKNIAGNLENTGYAVEGYSSLYNVLIMEEKQPIIALGAGGVSKLLTGGKPARLPNPKDPLLYIEGIEDIIRKKKEGLVSTGWL